MSDVSQRFIRSNAASPFGIIFLSMSNNVSMFYQVITRLSIDCGAAMGDGGGAVLLRVISARLSHVFGMSVKAVKPL